MVPRAALSHNAGAWAKFGRPEKRLRFLRAAEFGRARMAERATGRSSRGRNPRSRRRAAATQRPTACCAMARILQAPLVCAYRVVKMLENMIV